MFHFGNFLGFTYYIIYSHGAKLIIIFHLCKFLYAQFNPNMSPMLELKEVIKGVIIWPITLEPL